MRRWTRGRIASLACGAVLTGGAAVAVAQSGGVSTRRSGRRPRRTPIRAARSRRCAATVCGSGREQTRSEVLARHGVVATSQPLASEAGLEMLRKGGTAADAAVATAAMLGLTEPHSAGIGGDMEAIY